MNICNYKNTYKKNGAYHFIFTNLALKGIINKITQHPTKKGYVQSNQNILTLILYSIIIDVILTNVFQ